MKNILLLSICENENLNEELGLASISSFIRENGYNVMFCVMEKDKVDYSAIYNFVPDIIGCTVYDSSINMTKEVCKNIIKVLPEVSICYGGYYATYHKQDVFIENDFVKYVIYGEGEYVFLNLLNALSKQEPINNVKGLIFKNGNNIVINDREEKMVDLNNIPFPERSISNSNTFAISTSRGCLHNCSFCCSHNFWKCNNKTNWRGRDAKNVVDEIELLTNKYNVKFFNFVDSSFEDPNINRVFDITNEILNRNLEIKFSVFLRADFYKKVTDKLMDNLIKAGLMHVFLGIESGNDIDLLLYNKACKVVDNDNSIYFFKRYNIHLSIGFICINPYSSFNGLRENINFLKRHDLLIGHLNYIIYKLYRGGRLYDKIKNDNLIIREKENEYIFVDEKINIMVKYLKDNILGSDFYNFKNFISYYNSKYKYLLNEMSIKASHINVSKIINEQIEDLNDLLSTIGKNNYDSFNMILDAFENNDTIKVRNISEFYLSNSYYQKTIDKLQMLNLSFIKKIYKCDHDLYLKMNYIQIPQFIN